MSSHSPRLVLQTPVAETVTWIALESPLEVLQATHLDEVRPVLARAEAAAAAGRIAAGFVAYEAAPAFDPAFAAAPTSGHPLAWFGIFAEPTLLDPLPGGVTHPPALDWRASLTRLEYTQAVAAVHDSIEKGDAYQVNLTLRLAADFEGDPWDLFAALCRGQRSECCAFVDTGDWVFCSASPELFFQLAGERISCRPMKGTAPRGRWAEEDREQAEWLQESVKNRAENVMIVDMVRNDLGRIAVPNSVRVARLCHLERYPSLFQLTSTIEARTCASIEEIFGALFPCASITGAPKVRATQIIQALESRPRGIYTGAIGTMGPGRRAYFNVAIRTVQIHRTTQRAEYGTGGGIVWDSSAEDEWQECRTKALVLRPPAPDFELLETLLWDPGEGFLLPQRHLHRLASSADYFSYPCAIDQVLDALEAQAAQLPLQHHRFRVLLSRDGTIHVEAEPLVETSSRWRVAVARGPIDGDDIFLFHKTTHRAVYEHHRREFPDHDDVLLWNDKSEITESTLANVVARQGDRLVTPPLRCGLLAGTYRAELLARGEIAEATIHLQDLAATEEIYLINSVRRWIPLELDSATVLAVP